MTTDALTAVPAEQVSPMKPIDVPLRIPKLIHDKFQEALDKINEYYPDAKIPVADLISFYLFQSNTDEFPTDLAIQFLEFVRNGETSQDERSDG